MLFGRHFYPNQLTVMHAYVLLVGGSRTQTHNPSGASAMLYQLSHHGSPKYFIAAVTFFTQNKHMFCEK